MPARGSDDVRETRDTFRESSPKPGSPEFVDHTHHDGVTTNKEFDKVKRLPSDKVPYHEWSRYHPRLACGHRGIENMFKSNDHEEMGGRLAKVDHQANRPSPQVGELGNQICQH